MLQWRRSYLYSSGLPKAKCQTVIHQSNLTVVAGQYHSKRLLLLLLLYILTYSISCFHEVITAINILYQSNCVLPQSNTPPSSKILDNYQFALYFSDCLGALDGTHVEMHVPVSLQPRYRNRKGTISQNILAVCDFNMKFVYILAGWEGSAHDSRVLLDAQAGKGFKTPTGKYWLGKSSSSRHYYVVIN